VDSPQAELVFGLEFQQIENFDRVETECLQAVVGS
jgi:hypothetical protein